MVAALNSMRHRAAAPTAPAQTQAARAQTQARLLVAPCRYSSRDWGPYSVPEGSSSNAAQRLFLKALQQPLGDLCLDFNKCYINSRRGSSTLMDSSSSDTDNDMTAVSDITAAQDAAMCDALLQFQMLISASDTKARAHPSPGQFLECIDLISCHAYPDSQTSQLPALEKEVSRIALLARHELTTQHTTGTYSAEDSTDTGNQAFDEVQQPAAAVSVCCEGQHRARGCSGHMQHCHACPGVVDAVTATALVRAINKAMFGNASTAYSGSTADFYSPESNLLHLVVQNRTGSPAALAALYWEVSRRAGLPLEVLLLPGHTFLRPRVQGGCSWLVDPFNGGQVCNQGVVEARLNTCWGLQAPCISLDAHAMHSAACVSAGIGHKAGITRQQQQPPSSSQESQRMRHSSHRSTSEPGAQNGVRHTWSHDPDGVIHPHHQRPQQQEDVLTLAQAVSSEDVDTGNGASLSRAPASSSSAADRQVATPWGLSAHATPGCLLLRLLCNLRESYFCPLPASGFLRWGSSRACKTPAGKAVVWKALWTTRFARAMTPSAHHLIRDEGYALMQLGQQKEGMALLQLYLANRPDAPDLSRVKEFIIPS